MALSYLNQPKKADYQFKVINEVLTQYEIKPEKMFGCVVDDGKDIKAAMRKFPMHVWKLSCAAHKLNLCVNDIFKIQKVKIKTVGS